jgi:hypothetical protein
MRFRLIALALALIGFLVINHFGNQYGQNLILPRIDTPESVGQGMTAEDARLESEIDVLAKTRAMIDTLDALGVETVDAAELRREYRASVDHLSRLRMSYFLSQAIWRQTMGNMIWGVVVVIFLLPIAQVLDHRFPVGRLRTDEESETADPAPPRSDQETFRPV